VLDQIVVGRVHDVYDFVKDAVEHCLLKDALVIAVQDPTHVAQCFLVEGLIPVAQQIAHDCNQHAIFWKVNTCNPFESLIVTCGRKKSKCLRDVN
jgi:hypothetical protein